jgi:hypothetical protein
MRMPCSRTVESGLSFTNIGGIEDILASDRVRYVD